MTLRFFSVAQTLPKYYPYRFPLVWKHTYIHEAIELYKSKRCTFYFDTGVRPGIPLNERHKRDANPVPLSDGEVWRNGTKQIPFDCYDVPDGATFSFACNNPDLPEAKYHIVREIFNSSLHSKYAYFTKPFRPADEL